MWRGPQEYITYEHVATSSGVFRMSGSSNFDSFHGGWSVVSIHLVSVHVVHPYSSIDTTAAWKKLGFILSVRSEFHMAESLSIAVHAFASHVSMSISVDETLLPF